MWNSSSTERMTLRLFNIIKLAGTLVSPGQSFEQKKNSLPVEETISKILERCSNLGISRVIGEHVETEQQREVLQRLGVVGGQGWLVSKDLPFGLALDALSRQ